MKIHEISWHQKRVQEISVKTGRRHDWANTIWSVFLSLGPLFLNDNLARNAAHLCPPQFQKELCGIPGYDFRSFQIHFSIDTSSQNIANSSLEPERWNFGAPFQTSAADSGSHHAALALQSIALPDFNAWTFLALSFDWMKIVWRLWLVCCCSVQIHHLLLNLSCWPRAHTSTWDRQRMQSQNDATMEVGTAYLRFEPSTNIDRNLHNPIK